MCYIGVKKEFVTVIAFCLFFGIGNDNFHVTGQFWN